MRARERMVAGRRLTGQTLPVRIYGSAWSHRLLPGPLALRLAALRGQLEWHAVPRRRAEALELTRAIRGTAEPRFARRRLVEEAVRAEFQWRPWLYRRIATDGLEHVESARDRSGGALILAGAHVGPILGVVHAVARRGIRVYISGSEWGIPTRHGLRARWIALQNRWVEETGAEWIAPGGSYESLRELLERGSTIFIPVDSSGSLELALAGRPARVRSGIAALALNTGAPIVPAWTLRRGGRFVATFGPPIDPAEFGDRAELMQHVATAVGPAFLDEPEQVGVNSLNVWDDDLAREARRARQ